MRPDKHNTKLALEKLMEVRVVASTTDDEGDEVFGLVDTLQMHLQYESNSALEARIKADLKRLYNEGHDTIQARKEKKLGKNRVVEQIPITMTRNTTIMASKMAMTRGTAIMTSRV